MDNQKLNTLLMRAASNGRDVWVERILTSPDVDVNHRNGRGCTPLFMAALRGHDRVVELLLEREDVQVSIHIKGGIFLSLFRALKF